MCNSEKRALNRGNGNSADTRVARVNKSIPQKSNQLGMLTIAAGWVFAFAAIFIPSVSTWITYRCECAVIAAMLFGFGVGWQMRGER